MELQIDDDTLTAVRQAADGHPCTAGIGFFKQDGLIHRRWVPPGRDEKMGVAEQLVLPKRCRKAVLETAQEIPLDGHMGKAKTSGSRGGSTGLLCLKTLLSSAEVVSFARSPLNGVCRRHLLSHYPLLPNRSRRLQWILWGRFHGADLGPLYMCW